MDITAAIRAEARRTTGLTAPEFDYSLASADGHALGAMASAAYVIANRELPTADTTTTREELRQRRERGDALYAQVWPEIDAMIARAKATGYTGCAFASSEPIRYAR